MWYTLQKMNFCNDEKRDKQGLQVLTHWKLPRCQCPHSSMIAIFVMMRREINKDCRYWHIENTTWLPVSTQLKCVFVVVFQNRMHLSVVPPSDASRPWRWGDQAIALTAAVCSVLVVLNVDSKQKARQRGNISMGKQQCGILRTMHSKLTGTYGQASYSVIIATWCKLTIVIRPLESTNLEDMWD